MSFAGDLPFKMKKIGKSDYLNSHLVGDKILEGNNNIDLLNTKDEIKYNQIYQKFILSVEEVKFNEAKIGYIFKFELFNENFHVLESKITSSKSKINSLSKFKNIQLKDISELGNVEIMSSISFAKPIKPT